MSKILISFISTYVDEKSNRICYTLRSTSLRCSPRCSFHLLALKLICFCLAERCDAPLRALCGRPYWDAVDQPKVSAEAFRRQLRREAALWR